MKITVRCPTCCRRILFQWEPFPGQIGQKLGEVEVKCQNRDCRQITTWELTPTGARSKFAVEVAGRAERSATSA